MERILEELNYEEEVTAMLYSQGYEKREIAEMKCRAVSTINNQLQSVFLKMQVRNGRELSRMIYERLSGTKLTFNLSDTKRVFITAMLFAIFSVSFFIEEADMRRGRRPRVEIERTRTRGRRHGDKDTAI